MVAVGFTWVLTHVHITKMGKPSSWYMYSHFKIRRTATLLDVHLSAYRSSEHLTSSTGSQILKCSTITLINSFYLLTFNLY